MLQTDTVRIDGGTMPDGGCDLWVELHPKGSRLSFAVVLWDPATKAKTFIWTSCELPEVPKNFGKADS
jgi:hypothetical protein